MAAIEIYPFDHPFRGLSEAQSQLLANHPNWVAWSAEILAAKDHWAETWKRLIEDSGVKHGQHESVGTIVQRDATQRQELMAAYNRFIDAHIEYCRFLADNFPKYERPTFSILFWPVVLGLIAWAVGNIIIALLVGIAVFLFDMLVYDRNRRTKHEKQSADFDGDTENWRTTLQQWDDGKFRLP